MALKIPSNELVSEYVNKIKTVPKYIEGDNALARLLKCCASNNCLESVWLKVTVINSFYSAGVIDTWKLANHIVTILDFDNRIKSGDQELIEDIRRGHGIGRNGNERDFYSFATKYCSEHNKEKYPIFDKYVRGMLLAYKRKDNFAEFTEDDLRIYQRFVEIIFEFKKHYNLAGSIREIDWFLWLYGKEFFA